MRHILLDGARQTETLLLAVCGGVLGALFAYAAMGPLRRLVPSEMVAGAPITLDTRVLAFAELPRSPQGCYLALFPVYAYQAGMPMKP